MKTKEEKKNPKVDAYITRAKKWQDEIRHLRTIHLNSPLTEELKWGKPCYTFEGSNVVIILPLKEHCALLWAKGALLKDPHGILIRPTENTQAARQTRFTSVQAIVKLESVLRAYLQEAIEAEKAGLEVVYKQPSEFVIPEEIQAKLDENPALKTAFQTLTPGRQRGYTLYFSAPKQSKTRMSRIEKCTPQILQGKGLNDR